MTISSKKLIDRPLGSYNLKLWDHGNYEIAKMVELIGVIAWLEKFKRVNIIYSIEKIVSLHYTWNTLVIIIFRMTLISKIYLLSVLSAENKIYLIEFWGKISIKSRSFRFLFSLWNICSFFAKHQATKNVPFLLLHVDRNKMYPILKFVFFCKKGYNICYVILEIVAGGDIKSLLYLQK